MIPERLGFYKNDPKFWKKLKVLTFIIRNFERFLNFALVWLFRKFNFFLPFFRLYSERNYSLQLRRKPENFREKKPSYQKTLCFVKHTLFLPSKNRNVLTGVWIYVEIVVGSGIRAPTSGFPAAVTPNTCFIRDTNDYADLLELCASWAVSGKGKKTSTTELIIFRSKFFSTENNKVNRSKKMQQSVMQTPTPKKFWQSVRGWPLELFKAMQQGWFLGEQGTLELWPTPSNFNPASSPLENWQSPIK